MKDQLLAKLRDGQYLTIKEILLLIVFLSIPAILANISTLVMELIDASMVGHFSSDAAAAIGLVATSTWLLSGLSMTATIGFAVQVAQAIGAKEELLARKLVRLGLVMTLLVSFFHAGLGAAASGSLPQWLGGDPLINGAAAKYFLIFSLSLPLVQINSFCGALLQAGGNMRTPSILHILMCVLDVIFNYFLIFPEHGFGLGVVGAALGTALAQLVIAVAMLSALLVKSPALRLQAGEKLVFSKELLLKAFKIAVPVGVEQLGMTSAQIMSTKIVAPLGLVALAANSFSITIEGLCYMPGFGIAAAATTLIGQSIGAKRQKLTRYFAWSSVSLGMAAMGLMGLLMYLFAPEFLALLTPDMAVQQLGTTILRIEAVCEPLYGAAIVAVGVFRGAGNTLVPSIFSLISMWLIRLPLAYFMVQVLGLNGFWLAMTAELCCRGLLLLLLVFRRYGEVK